MKEYSASILAPIADSRRKAFSNSSWTLTKSERGESLVCSRSALRESGASLSSAPKVVTHVARVDGSRMRGNNHLCSHMYTVTLRWCPPWVSGLKVKLGEQKHIEVYRRNSSGHPDKEFQADSDEREGASLGQ